VPLPNKAKGYVGVVQDLKGKKIGVSGRGAGTETNYLALMAAAGLSPSDVTFVPLGGPPPAYQALTVGKLVDALVMFEPIPTLCAAHKTCEVAIDLTTGDGPPVIKAMNGAVITMVMRREMVEKNPKLVRAYIAAMQEATRWAQDPANFNEVVKIYEPIVAFGSAPNADAMRRSLLKTELATASPGMETSRPALKAIVDFAVANKTIDKPIPVEKLIWKEAP
jgi:NitT/TauT family transport system substrate-binding protein